MNPAQWIWSSITRRITAAAVLLTMTIVTALGVISYVTMHAQIRATIDANLQEDADRLALHIERLFSAINENASNLAHNNIVSNSLQDPRGRDRYLLPFLLSYQLPEHISFTLVLRDRRGSVLAGTSPATSQRQVKDPALIEQVVKNGMPVAKLLPGERNNTLMIAYPVYAPVSTGPEGYLVLEVLLDDVFERAWYAESAAQPMNVSLQCCDETIWAHRTFEAKNTATYSRPLHNLRPPFDGLRLAILVSEPAETAYLPLRRLAMTYGAAGLIILLMTLVLARLLAGRLTGPLMSLTAAVDKVTAGGSLAVTIDPHGQDEISTLGKAFGTMLSRLREATGGLEQRVQERTRDLEHAYGDLQAEKAFSETVIDSLPGVFYVYDEQRRLVRWNKNNEHVTGYTAEELSRITMIDLVPPEERRDLAAKMSEVFTAGYAETEVSILSKSGKRTPYFVTGIRTVINGRPLLIGMGIDIAGRKQAEEALRESEEKFRSLIESTSDWIWEIDANSVYTYSSPKITEILGYEPAEVLGRTPFDLMPAEEAVRLKPHVAAIVAERGPFLRMENTARHKDGRLILLETSGVPFFDASGQWQGYRGIDRDITERKEAELRIMRSEERLRAIFERSGTAITIISMDRKILQVNAALASLLGYTEEELLGRNVADISNPEDDAVNIDQYRGMLQGHYDHFHMEKRYYRKDGSIVWGLLTVTLMHGADGRPEFIVGMIEDITGRKQAEQALEDMNRTLHLRVQEEVEKNRERDRLMMVQSRQAAMGEMLGNISHQWRQPLNIVGLIIQDILDAQAHGQLTPEYLEKNVRRGMDVIQHMSQTIDDFRGFYRKDKEKQTFVLNEIVNRVLSFVAAGFRNNNIAISVKMPEAVEAAGYPNEFAQVLLNILNNARDVLLERKAPSPKLIIRVFNDQGRSVVTIEDNAGGIADSNLDHVFEPFFTTKDEGKGTGIGLYMSKLIIEKNMSGKLTAQNTADGAEFRIEL